jgi:hypothetical protein
MFYLQRRVSQVILHWKNINSYQNVKKKKNKQTNAMFYILFLT